MLFYGLSSSYCELYLHDSDYNSQVWPKTFVWFLFYKLRPHPSELTKLQFFVKILTSLHNLLVRFPMLISKQSFTQSRELFFVQNSIPANENHASCLQSLKFFLPIFVEGSKAVFHDSQRWWSKIFLSVPVLIVSVQMVDCCLILTSKLGSKLHQVSTHTNSPLLQT